MERGGVVQRSKHCVYFTICCCCCCFCRQQLQVTTRAPERRRILRLRMSSSLSSHFQNKGFFRLLPLIYFSMLLDLYRKRRKKSHSSFSLFCDHDRNWWRCQLFGPPRLSVWWWWWWYIILILSANFYSVKCQWMKILHASCGGPAALLPRHLPVRYLSSSSSFSIRLSWNVLHTSTLSLLCKKVPAYSFFFLCRGLFL